MNTKSLEYFIKVVDVGLFTKAAEELYISQSAISQQKKTLEEDLGYSLMNRNKKGFELTGAGKYIYLEGKNILNQMREISQHAYKKIGFKKIRIKRNLFINYLHIRNIFLNGITLSFQCDFLCYNYRIRSNL